MNALNRKSLMSGALLALGVAAAIALGSRRFTHFDPALTGYAIGSLLAAFAVGYRFMIWAQRPPSRLYFKRGAQLFFQRAGTGAPSAVEKAPRPAVALPRGAGTLGRAMATGFIAQTFIFRRSFYRWIMHLCLSGGCTLAFAITFPLVFGWVHFEPLSGNAEIYQVMAFGAAVDHFSVHSLKAAILFNALNISAALVLVGLLLAGIRRATDAGERATQTFFEDILPLLLIFAVTVTGLALTVSYKYLAGGGHGIWAVIHMASVVALLIYIPFGKLFHMFQRTCALCVSRYKKIGTAGPRAHCRGCGEDFASQMHVDDLKGVLDELGFNYRFSTSRGELHYQDICPMCRRKLLALNQGRSMAR
jgi:NNP family nitrate/nitrite transporter-like MFS transporter